MIGQCPLEAVQSCSKQIIFICNSPMYIQIIII